MLIDMPILETQFIQLIRTTLLYHFPVIFLLNLLTHFAIQLILCPLIWPFSDSFHSIDLGHFPMYIFLCHFPMSFFHVIFPSHFLCHFSMSFPMSFSYITFPSHFSLSFSHLIFPCHFLYHFPIGSIILLVLCPFFIREPPTQPVRSSGINSG